MTTFDSITALPKNQAIFGKNLANKQLTSREPKPLLRQKKRRALVTLILSVLALLFYSIFFFYGTAADYLRASGEIESMQSDIQNYNENVIPLLEAEKNMHKSAYDQEFQESIAALDTVFPEGVEKRNIVQLLESFSSEVALIAPPFEFTSINFEKTIEAENYTIIPVSTTIHSSVSGFDSFLALVERSGMIYEDASADEKKFLDKMVRLMSISNISLKYRGLDEKTGRDGGVDFSVKLNFYSQGV